MIDQRYEERFQSEPTSESFGPMDYEEDLRGMAVAAAAFGATLLLLLALLVGWIF